MQFNELEFELAITDSKFSFEINYDENQLEQLKLFISEFIKWNAVHNLSAVTDFKTLMRAHLLDSIAIIKPVMSYLNGLGNHEQSVADLGSGGGFPSVIMAILMPNINIYAIESIKKKTAFLQNIKARLKLTNYHVVDQRIENFAMDKPHYFDATISRAFTELKNFLNYSILLLKPNSLVFAMKSQKVDDELKGVNNQWKLIENIELKIPRLEAYRCLLVISSMRK